MKIIFGIIAICIGFTLVWKTEAWLNFFGRVAWAERHLGTEGGSRIFYKFIGILIIFIGLLLVTGLYNDFMSGTVGQLAN